MDDERTYQFLTPVFGGGVKVDGHKKPHDEVTPVRAASIRGQLRFWWRACNPRGLATVEGLRAAEDSIFGSTSVPSRLIVEVLRQPSKPTPKDVLEGAFRAAEGMHGIDYGAFPLRDTSNNEAALSHGVLHQYNHDWRVRFRYEDVGPDKPSIQHDIDAALWAWAHFGGLGGRTRRGFGAISQTSGNALLSIKEGWQRYATGVHCDWPHLPPWEEGAVLIRREPAWTSGLEAQRYLLGKLRDLRQGPDARNRGGTRQAGRSFWPEADEIRRLTGRAHPQHKPEHAVRAFPRGAFGLPIIFHFKDEKKGDPAQTTLMPSAERNRWASPLILRPHQGRDGIEALALLLRPRVSGTLELRDKRNKKIASVKRDINHAEARQIRPMGPQAIDPLARFWELFS